MNKLIGGLLIALFILAAPFLIPSRALAVAEGAAILDSQFGLLGQDHHYSVMFRGNGEAIVTARIVFANEDEAPLSTLSLRVPRVDPKDILAFQISREKICSLYQPAVLKVEYTPAVCLEYQEPDYFQSWYSNGKYQKASLKLEADTLTIALPRSINQNASGSVILFFRAFGYAKKTVFGAYDFTFESLKTEDRIRTLRVGITTDSDIFLRGGKGKVDYRFDEGVAILKTTTISAPTASPQLDYFVQQIGQGTINKSANNLLPLDSYLVKGSFADSKVKLYAKEILLTLVASLIFFYLIFRLSKWLFFKSGHLRIQAAASSAADLLLVFGLSFVSAFLMLAYTLALVFGRVLFLSILPYGAVSIFAILIILISIGIYGLLLFLPALVLGLRRGIFWGLTAFGLTIFWLVVGGIVVFLVFFLIGNRIYPPYPIIPMTSVSEPVNLDSTPK